MVCADAAVEPVWPASKFKNIYEDNFFFFDNMSWTAAITGNNKKQGEKIKRVPAKWK